MADYRYLACDVQTGAVLTELPLGDVSLQSVINGAGTARGTLKLSDVRVRRAFDDVLTQPGRCALAVLRDEAPLWGGVIWTRPYQFDTETLSLGATEWGSALGRRKLTSDHTWNAAAVETIAGDIVTDAQTGTGGAWGMTVAGATGLTSTYSVLTADRVWALTALQAALKAAGTAVDYQTTIAYSGTAVLPVLKLGSPTLGRAGTVNGLSVAEPISGVWAEDATAWATTVYASSRGVGATAAVATVTNAAALAAGYPRWDLEYTSDSDKDTAALTAAATAFLNARAPGGAFGPMTVRATDPDVSQLQLGDTILATFSPNARFPDGLTADVRVTGWTLQPGEDGGVDTLALEVASV